MEKLNLNDLEIDILDTMNETGIGLREMIIDTHVHIEECSVSEKYAYIEKSIKKFLDNELAFLYKINNDKDAFASIKNKLSIEDTMKHINNPWNWFIDDPDYAYEFHITKIGELELGKKMQISPNNNS